MCPFVEKKKKEKSVVFSLTYKYQETSYTIFSNPSNPPPTPIIPTPPIIRDSRVYLLDLLITSLAS